ncbi:MAG: hypothetical protein IPL24_06200 [Bacteroidetes bacterium]|nr:hypothetical protein [Bacteroidota bacterium]
MTKKYSTLFIALLLFIGNVKGQTSWTLQQCLQRALDYNITIKQSVLSNEIDKITVNQNTAALFPSLNGSASQNWYYGKVLIRIRTLIQLRR